MELKALGTESLTAITAFDRLCFPTDHWKEEIWASNHAMQRVFTKCGYHLNKIEENYYDNPTERAYNIFATRRT